LLGRCSEAASACPAAWSVEDIRETSWGRELRRRAQAVLSAPLDDGLGELVLHERASLLATLVLLGLLIPLALASWRAALAALVACAALRCWRAVELVGDLPDRRVRKVPGAEDDLTGFVAARRAQGLARRPGHLARRALPESALSPIMRRMSRSG